MQISIPLLQVRGALSGGWDAYVRFTHYKIQIRGVESIAAFTAGHRNWQ